MFILAGLGLQVWSIFKRKNLKILNLFEAIIIAIVEGLTEFLPVSSTGHMMIASAVMGMEQTDFVKLYIVAIQLGAILSVVVIYFKRFFQTCRFLFQIIDRLYSGCNFWNASWRYHRSVA